MYAGVRKENTPEKFLCKGSELGLGLGSGGIFSMYATLCNLQK